MNQLHEEATRLPPVAELIKRYIEAKQVEAEAIARRVILGDTLAAILGAPSEGSKTHEVDGYTVKVTQPVNRRVDWAVWDAIPNPPEHLPVTVKRELDLKGLRWVQENQPDLYRELSKAITATPGRVALEIKETSK